MIIQFFFHQKVAIGSVSGMHRFLPYLRRPHSSELAVYQYRGYTVKDLSEDRELETWHCHDQFIFMVIIGAGALPPTNYF